MKQQNNKVPDIIKVQWALFVILCLVLAGYVYFILSDPYPLTSREGAAMAPVYLMQKGLNPYDLAYNPNYNNSYVFIQQYLNLLAADIFSSNLITFRIEGHLFIIALCILMYFSCYKINSNRFIALIFSAIMYASCLYLNTAEARADAYGLFFYVAAISSFLLFKNRNIKVLVLVVGSLLGFYTKLYFFAGLIIVGSYECIIFSARRLARIALFTALLVALSTFIVERFIYPGYFHLVLKPFLIFGSVAEKNYIFSFQQLAVMLVLISPLLFGLLINKRQFFSLLPVQVIFSRNKYKVINGDTAINSYLLFGVISSTAGTIFFLSTHIGNQMTYLFHLMLPWYLLYFVSLFKRMQIATTRICTMAIFCLMFFVLFLRPWNYVIKSKGDWSKIYHYIDESKDILGAPLVANYIIEENKPLYNSGHSEFVLATSDNLEGFKGYTKKDLILLKGLDTGIINDTRRYYTDIKEGIRNRRFDLILLDNTATVANHYHDLVVENYFKRDSATVYLPHSRHRIDVSVYKRK